MQRVADRVEAGGHDVPLEDLRRRFRLGLQNLFTLYRPVVDTWALHNTTERPARKIAQGDAKNFFVFNKAEFESLIAEFNLKL